VRTFKPTVLALSRPEGELAGAIIAALFFAFFRCLSPAAWSSTQATAFPTTRASVVTCTATATRSRSRLAVTIIQQKGDPANGMVMDFSEVKALAMRHLVDLWDHAFLAWAGDQPVVDFLHSLPEHKTVLLDCVPTAENLAQLAFTILDAVYRDSYGNQLRLERVRLYETPNCWAEALRG
jgi:6-pyruvoyltetrahydropterin/6-carboxytetrahydropterin synthase